MSGIGPKWSRNGRRAAKRGRGRVSKTLTPSDPSAVQHRWMANKEASPDPRLCQQARAFFYDSPEAQRGKDPIGRSAARKSFPPRDGGRRIISMRYGHADEEAYWRKQMG